MKTVLIEPTDVLFFRDAVPMSAGQGKGAGCRLPFPSTLHEAFRASLLLARGETGLRKEIPGRPRTAERRGNWHAVSYETDVKIASKAFRSLHTVGPFPWHPEKGLLLPVPLDAAYSPDRGELARLQLWRNPDVRAIQKPATPALYRPLCLPVAVTQPDKHGQLRDWWTVDQFQAYLRGERSNHGERFKPVLTADLWQAEHRVGVQIDPESFAAAQGQLYAGSYLRMNGRVRFAAGVKLAKPYGNEEVELQQLQWLLLGGEFRLARLWHSFETGESLPDLFAPLRTVPEPRHGNGPCLLKWVLITPAIFARGSLPGWCAPAPTNSDDKPVGLVRLGASARKKGRNPLPGRAFLVSWCIGKPRAVSGWDVVDGSAKPTMLAVPEGSVFYFLCESPETAAALAAKLHWQPRSDFYGEKGCGYGLVSFDVQMHWTSKDVHALAKELFNP